MVQLCQLITLMISNLQLVLYRLYRCQAINYNPDASVDDGQCYYNVSSLKITVNPCMDVDSVRLTGPFGVGIFRI